MADLDDDAIIVSLPANGDGTTITKVEDVAEKADETDPIADLKGQFDTLRNVQQNTTQRLTTTEQELATTKQELAEARKEVSTSQIDTVTSGLAAAEAEASAGERDYIAAAEAGDFAAQARAQRKISGAEARIQRLQEAKADLEDAKPAKVTTRTEPTQQARQQATDPVEAVIVNGNIDPNSRAANWLRTHRDYVTDKTKNARMMKTHFDALENGIQEGSSEYFERLDTMAAEKLPVTKVETKVETTGKRPSSAAAPSGHSGGGMNGGGTEVRLTAREAASSTDGTLVWNHSDPKGKFQKGDPIGHAEMARRKMIMQKQGLYDKSASE